MVILRSHYQLQVVTTFVTLLFSLFTARSKTRKPQKSRKFFSKIFKSDFSILAVGQNQKLRNKKTLNNISEISEVSEFSICHFFIFQKFSFSIFYSSKFRTLCLCYALFSMPFKVFFPSPKIYAQNITML